jgi:hypothetical protein
VLSFRFIPPEIVDPLYIAVVIASQLLELEEGLLLAHNLLIEAPGKQ